MRISIIIIIASHVHFSNSHRPETRESLIVDEAPQHALSRKLFVCSSVVQFIRRILLSWGEDKLERINDWYVQDEIMA